MINAIVLDKNKITIANTCNALQRFPNLVRIINKLSDPFIAKSILERNQHINTIFVDDELPLINCIDFIKSIYAKRNIYVFLMANTNQYATEAIKLDVYSYILKPLKANDIQASLMSLVQLIACEKNNNAEGAEHTIYNSKMNTIKLNVDRKIKVLDVDSIVFFEASGSYTKLYFADGSQSVICQNLGALEKVFPSNIFYRIHKSYLINLKKIKEIDIQDHTLTLLSEDILPFSRRKQSDLLAVI